MKIRRIARTWEEKLRQAQEERLEAKRRQEAAQAALPPVPAPVVRVRRLRAPR